MEIEHWAKINLNCNDFLLNSSILFFHEIWSGVFPPFRSGVLLELYQFFLNLDMMLETHMRLCVTEPDFPEKIFSQKLGKWTKNGPKTGIFEFIEKFGHSFLLNLFYNENQYYFLCSYSNPMFWKIFYS